MKRDVETGYDYGIKFYYASNVATFLQHFWWIMRRSLLKTRVTATQAFSGAIAYYACEALSDYFVFRDGVNPLVARFFFFLFPFLAVTAFALLTFAWHRTFPHKSSGRFPEVLMILGALILMPVYFEFASHLIYNLTAMHLSEVMEDLYWYYLMFPLTVMDFGSYTLSLHVFALAAISALLTGYFLRRRERLVVSLEN